MWADAIESRVYSELRAGFEVPGWKLVDGDLSDRQWAKPPDEVVSKLQEVGLTKDHYTVSKMAGPAAIEKLVRRSARSASRPLSKDQWDSLQPLITREQLAPKVVPDSDPRSPSVIDLAADFDNIE